VQRLRRRAQANGSLQSNDQYTVQQQGSDLAVYPAQPQLVYVPYYDPYVVYGTWWWPAYRPVFWRPWYPRPAVFASTTFVVRSVDWHQRHLVHPGFHGQVVRQVVRNNQPQPVIQSHTSAQPYVQSRGQPYIQNHTAPARPIVDSARPRPQPWGQRVEQGREFHREAPRAAPQAPVAIPSQPPMRSIAATVVNQSRQPVARAVAPPPAAQAPRMRQPFGQSQQRGPRMESRSGNSHQQRRG
jgi:hypothetical protein